MTHDDTSPEATPSKLDEAADDGALPYVAEENAAADRGEDDSHDADAESKADEAARGDVVGGVNMH